MGKLKTGKVREARKVDRGIERLAQKIPNQKALAEILLSEDDPFKRKAFFDMISPHLRFKGTFPTRVHA